MLRGSLIALAWVAGAPLLAGCLDAVCYFWFDETITGVRWSGDHSKATIAAFLAGGGIALWIAANVMDA